MEHSARTAFAQGRMGSFSCPTQQAAPEHLHHHFLSSFFLVHVFNLETRAPFLSPGSTQSPNPPASAPPPVLKPCTTVPSRHQVFLLCVCLQTPYPSFSIFLGNLLFPHHKTWGEHCTFPVVSNPLILCLETPTIQ